MVFHNINNFNLKIASCWVWNPYSCITLKKSYVIRPSSLGVKPYRILTEASKFWVWYFVIWILNLHPQPLIIQESISNRTGSSAHLVSLNAHDGFPLDRMFCRENDSCPTKLFNLSLYSLVIVRLFFLGFSIR